MRILIVDDDYISRAQTKSLLLGYGDCDCAPNGQLAFDLFAAAHAEGFPYKLISLDVEMPGLSGQAVSEMIRDWEQNNGHAGKSSEAKIVMISAMDDGKSVLSSFGKGAEAYLVKPLTPDKLRQTLEEINVME